MVKKDRSDCVMGLLAKGADAMAIGSHGNNALHHAIIVRLFIFQIFWVFSNASKCVKMKLIFHF